MCHKLLIISHIFISTFSKHLKASDVVFTMPVLLMVCGIGPCLRTCHYKNNHETFYSQLLFSKNKNELRQLVALEAKHLRS